MNAREILFISELRSILNFPIPDINEGGFVSVTTKEDKDGKIETYVITSEIFTVTKTLELMANRLNSVKI
jgi:hypothetical protein